MVKPEVSVIVPCFNEEKTILGLIEAIGSQTFGIEKMEIIIADAFSTDVTRRLISDFQKSHPEVNVRVVDNPKRIIPSALNIAIRESQSEIICRMDAHSIPAVDYIEHSVEALRSGLGDNVGGVIDIRPGAESWIARSIAVATAHPFGVGDAKYRWAKTAGLADTVAFGTLFKSKIEEVGFFNETLKINEDYEFNARLRAIGGKIWIDPLIRAVYYSRPSLNTLAKQYFSYGFWKLKMLKSYPKTIRWRQALPPLFVLGILMLLLISFVVPPWFIFLASILTGYLLVLLAASSIVAYQKKSPNLIIGIPLAIMTMHFSWGTGFWWSIFNRENKGN